MMDDMRLLRRVVLCVSIAIVWVLLHVGCALTDEADRISSSLSQESSYPWLPSKEEWPKRSPDEQEQHWIRFREEFHQRFHRSSLFFFTGVCLMVYGIPATILGTEFLLSKMVDEL